MPTVSQLGSFGDVSGGPLVFRNKIINGNFDIWQRGTSQTATGYGSDDRWKNENAGSTKTHSRQSFTVGQTDVPGNPKYFSRTVVSSVAGAGSLVAKLQAIEDVSTFAGKTVTLSFWAKADANKNIAVEFAQSFGTGGSPSSLVTGIGVTQCALTTSWKKFSVTANIPSISGKTLGTNNDSYLAPHFWFDAGSDYNARTGSLGQQSGTFDIAQVQLEAGSAATPFEERPLNIEQTLCYRYYQSWGGAIAFEGIGYGSCSSATDATVAIPLLAQLRAIPVLSYDALASWGVTNASGALQTATSLSLPANGNAVKTTRINIAVASGLVAGNSTLLAALGTLSARLALSAEL